ncbi:LOW QUALITY PROTEIN: tripartite motif-containing protein 6-like [Erethizon dorsatum]
MTSRVLVGIQEEVTCPICLELLTEPLSIDCGHSFCQACITENSEKSVISQEKENSCPVCQTSYHPRNLRPNQHLANIAERLREVVLGPGRQPNVILCAHHGEKLQLFCKEDGKLICWLCERSQEHRGHHTFLMEEVAQEYQEMFQESLKKLRKEEEEAERLKAVIREKRASWKNQMEPERHRIQKEFNHLRSILDKEEQRTLRKLEEEERKGLSIIEKVEGEVIRQSQCLRELISDLEYRCQGSTVDLLQDVNDLTQRSEFWTLRKPQALPTKLRSAFRAPDLKKMLQVFRELTDVQSYWAIKKSLRRRTSGVRTGRSSGSSIMASKILASVEKEVTCAMCLELLTEPLSLGCGHSLCQACVTVNSAEAEAGSGKESSCPVCGVRYPRGNLCADQHQADIVEKLREVKLSTVGKKRDLCALHGEKLQLFCEEDRKVICWLCERSREHCGHHTFLMEEVTKECQEKLQAALKRLRKEQQEAEKLKADIGEDRISWKCQMQTRQRIRTEFNRLRSILDDEEQKELQRLEVEEKKTLDNLAQAKDELAQQSQVVKELISDLERRSRWSAGELLQDMSGIMKWYVWVSRSGAFVL